MTTLTPEQRPFEYDSSSCWQYEIRQKNLQQDLDEAGLTQEQVEAFRVSDFVFAGFTKESDTYEVEFPKVRAFIERHEWLGKMSLYPTHFFTAYYKDSLAGVVVMDMPNSYSNLLGKNTRKIERLISRGACISWSPKNLASSLIMFAINYMVKNTRYRLFTAYSDPEAMELGTIYQACNFYYLGQHYGAKTKYRLPGSDKWVSDRSFRSRSAYKRYARELKIDWKDDWSRGSVILWDNIPEDVEIKLRARSKEQYKIAEVREIPLKHKYAYVKGANKKETKTLRKKFLKLNKKQPLPYPKTRGAA